MIKIILCPCTAYYLCFVSDGNSLKNRYIQSASLNGEKFTRTWLTYKELMNGGTIQYKMGNKPNKSWGTSIKDRPYSVSVNLK